MAWSCFTSHQNTFLAKSRYWWYKKGFIFDQTNRQTCKTEALLSVVIKQDLTAIKSNEQLQQILCDKSKEGTIRIKQDLICIYNEVLSSGIKSENKKIVDMAVKKYQFKKNSIYLIELKNGHWWFLETFHVSHLFITRLSLLYDQRLNIWIKSSYII